MHGEFQGKAPPREAGLVGLREEIRQAGERSDSFRRAWRGVLTLVVSAAGIAVGLPWMPCVLLGLCLGVLVTEPLAAGYRLFRRRDFRRRLSQLAPDQRAGLLAPLWETSLGDTRRLVDPLVEEFRHSPEVAPAGTPEGHGVEVSGA